MKKGPARPKRKKRDEFYIPVLSYTVGELVYMYETTYRKFKAWMADHEHVIGKRSGNSYTMKQVERIFECLSEPNRPLTADKEELKAYLKTAKN